MSYGLFDFFICIICFVFSCWVSDNVAVESDYIFSAVVRFVAFFITYMSLIAVYVYLIYYVMEV